MASEVVLSVTRACDVPVPVSNLQLSALPPDTPTVAQFGSAASCFAGGLQNIGRHSGSSLTSVPAVVLRVDCVPSSGRVTRQRRYRIADLWTLLTSLACVI